MDEPMYAAPGGDAAGRPLLPPAASRRRDGFPPPPPSARRVDTSSFAPPTDFSMARPLDDYAPPRLHDLTTETPAAGTRPVYDVPLFGDKPVPVHDITPGAFTTPAAPPTGSWQLPSLADAPPPTTPAYPAPAPTTAAFPAAPPAGYDIPKVVSAADVPPPFGAAADAPPPFGATPAADVPPPAWDAVPAHWDAPAPATPEDTLPPAATRVFDLLSGEALPAEPVPTPPFEVPSAPLMSEQAPPPPAFPAPRLEEPVAVVEEAEGTGDLLGALREVLFRGASDLHISAGAPPMLRIDGALGPITDAKPWSRETVRSTLLSLLSPYERERFDESLELDFAYTLTANARFRVNYYQDRGAMSAAFRIIPNEVKNLAQLGIPEAVASFATLPRGLVLVTGPTGSGKSTTLAALIDIVNSTRTDHIMTVEDPIEFLHRNKKSLVHQREVGRDTHSFSSALKHVLRQDPDVILIGELRDLETISTALTAAETGHLVFATLHTQDAAQTIDRIIDVYPPHQQMQIRSQLASTLQGIVCQTLVKRSTGAGRVVAAEVLMMTPAIGNLIREGKTFQIGSAMQAGRAQGMATLDQHLAELVNDGSISRQSAIDKARDIASMTRMITRVDVAEQPEGSFGSFAAPTMGQN